MNHSQCQPGLAQAILHVEQATRISSRHNFRARGLDLFQLPIKELPRHLGLDEIVDAGAAAAPVALRQLAQFQTGNAFQECVRLGGDLLTVTKVTRLD